MEHKTFPDTGLPIAEILVLAGFLFIYTLEELMHMILVCTGQLEGHGHEGHGHTHENIEVPIEESIQVNPIPTDSATSALSSTPLQIGEQ